MGDGGARVGMSAALEALDVDGFVVLPALLSTRELAAALGQAERLLQGVEWSNNDFDGRRTRRVYSLLARLGPLEALVTHPLVRKIVTARLGEAHQLGMLVLNAVDPGQGSQAVHYDAGVYPLPRDVEAETNVIWALDDLTDDNGATLVATGSHRWPKGRPQPDDLAPLVMPAGSAVVYSGRLWHAAGHNRSTETRRALICEHVLPWLRPADNHLLPLGREQIIKLSPELRRLAGLSAPSPYLGFVGGQDPEEWLHTLSSTS